MLAKDNAAFQCCCSFGNNMTRHIAVILPAYNEALTIGPVIEAFATALPDAEIVVIDNASTDATYELAAATLKRLPVRGTVLRERAKGKANAIRRAFLEVYADVYLMADADMTYPAHQAHALLDPILSGEFDMVVGDRISNGRYGQENKRPAHQFGNHLVRYLINRLFSSRLKDVLSGYRAMNRRFVKSYPILVKGFELETDLTLHAVDGRFRLLEIPIQYQDRPAGSFSKLSTVKDGLRVLNTITQIVRHYRPMQFFSAIALVLLVLGLLAGFPAIADYLQYSYVYRVPLAILAVALVLSSMLSFATGLILSTIVRGQKAQLERELMSHVQAGNAH